MSQPAPGALEAVRAFVNSVNLEDDEEQLTDPKALGAWLREHDLLGDGGKAPTAADLRRGSGAAALRPAAAGVDGALGRLLAMVAAAQADGSWERLKACPWDTCRWAFYDHSKNRSGRWCNMQVCGNRAKVAAYRRRAASSFT